MPSLSVARSFNSALTFPYRPVGVFVGGTSGIGEGLVRTFAQHTEGNADIVIVGRNRAAGEAILASLPTPPPPAEPPRREFFQCDVTLMRNVQQATDDLAARLPRLNYLAVTTGFMTLNGRDETDEGIDRKLAVHYYARWKFFNNLMPLLQKAKDEGQDVKAMTVLAPGNAGPIDANDLGLKKGFSATAAGLQAPSYNDAMVESFAQRHPTLSFVHAHPGLVRTSLGSASSSALIRFTVPPLMRLLGVTSEECAEYLWYGLHHAPAGASRVSRKGEDLQGKGLYTNHGVREKLWNHTVEETKTQSA